MAIQSLRPRGRPRKERFDTLEGPKGQIVFVNAEGEYVEYEPPKDDKELKFYLEFFFGIKAADKAHCPGHSAPLEAISAAYFNKYDVVIWKASRGLGGKTTLLAGLAVLSLLRKADVVILGGSADQSKNVHKEENKAWNHVIETEGGEVAGYFTKFQDEDVTQTSTRMIWGNRLVAIPASNKSARGPHPNFLFIDELDEVEPEIVDVSFGQPMAKNGIPAQIVLSSTHQYPDGTMSAYLQKAKDQPNWKVFEWCYLESHEDNGGWLTQTEIDTKKRNIPAYMWKTEFDLQEPQSGNRMFLPGVIRAMFRSDISSVEDQLGICYEFQKPNPDGKYFTGVDWAQTQDFTVIITMRYDVTPARIVAYERIQRRPYPVMAAKVDARMSRWGGKLVHDAIGVGAVMKDYLEVKPIDYRAQGKDRSILFGEYTVALEHNRIISSDIVTMRDEHKYVKWDDLYDPSGHPPDTFFASALAWIGVVGKAYGSNYKVGGKVLKIRTW